MLNVAMMEEWSILNGDSTYGLGLQFDGLLKQISTNVIDMASAPLSLTALTTGMRTAVEYGGKPQAIVVSLYDNQRISDLVLSSFYRLTQAGAGAFADITAGVAVTSWSSPFGKIDIIPSRYIPEAYNLRSALIIDDKSMAEDGNAICMVDLMPVSSIDLAITATAYKTLVAEFTVLQLTIERFQVKMTNIGRA